MEPVRIDGSQGEGGGQILRTSISLAAILQKPVEITNIRSKRPNPGLRPSHLAAVKVVADLFGAHVENLQVGSTWVRFSPSGRFECGSVKVDIGTAGSIPLALMTIVPAVALSGNTLEIEITGGTDVKASPTIDYLRYVVAEAYRSAGIKFAVQVQRRGYYPKGGGIIKTTIDACRSPSPIELLNGRQVSPKIASVCSQLPKHVAERQISAALLALEKGGVTCKNYTASFETAASPGTSIIVYSASDFGGPYIGGDSIGEVGKRAEQVGQEAAGRFLESAHASAAVDPFLSDMMVIPACLGKGTSQYRVAKVTEHLRTNLQVAALLTGSKHEIKKISDNNYLVTVEGA